MRTHNINLSTDIISEYEDRVEIYSPEDTDATCVTAYFDNTGILQDVSMKNNIGN